MAPGLQLLLAVRRVSAIAGMIVLLLAVGCAGDADPDLPHLPGPADSTVGSGCGALGQRCCPDAQGATCTGLRLTCSQDKICVPEQGYNDGPCNDVGEKCCWDPVPSCDEKLGVTCRENLCVSKY